MDLSKSLAEDNNLEVPSSDDKTESELEMAVLKLLDRTPAVEELDGQGLTECPSNDSADAASETVFSGANSGAASETSDDEMDLSNEKLSRKSFTTRSSDPAILPGETSVAIPSETELRQRRDIGISTSPKEETRTFDISESESKALLSPVRAGEREREFEDDYPLIRTSSWAVSCFVCGVLVTLFVISAQRRDLLAGNRFT